MSSPKRFRAWDGKKMHYWDSTDHGAVDLITGTPYKKLFYLPMSWLVGDSNDWVWMQYTGLKDKNGKEIYEGDVVRHHNQEQWIYKVDMEELDYIIPLNDDADDHTGDIQPDALHARPNNFEIIGNIYEHPELLNNK